MMDLSNETIKDLFYRQVRELTLNGRISTFDLQFSDRWINPD